MSPITIENDRWSVDVMPEHGATILAGRVRCGDEWVDVLRPTPREKWAVAPDTASYPLVPWSNRIRDAVLRWRGVDHRLRAWPGMAHAMHGTGFEFPWEIAARSKTDVRLAFDSRGFSGVNFPWAFRASLEYAVDGDSLRVSMRVENAADEPFPVGLGHHPYFVRRLPGGDRAGGDDAWLFVACERAYPLDDALPIGPADGVDPRVDFRVSRPLGEQFVDDCLTGRTAPIAARIDYGDRVSLALEADDVLGHVVVYIPPGKDFFAVEPVSNANDAFNLHGLGMEGVGAVELAPGEDFGATFSIVATT